MNRILLTFFLLFSASSLVAQHVPGTDWKQRETEYFIIIYPESLSRDAAALAVVMDRIADENADQLPVMHPKKKWPVILTDHGVTANGFVSLAPRRSVWYSTPAEDFTTVSDWWLLMATHEGRHMAQFDAADQGFTRFLHGLFGEYGWGAGLVLGVPDWLLEGDAVVQESELSDEGRGRDPLFTREMQALILQQPDVGYIQAANSSFSRNIPNHYYLGYTLSTWIRNEYGLEALEEIYRKSGRIGLPVIAINSAAKSATGRRPRDLYDEMARALIAELAPQMAAADWTPSIPVSFDRPVSADGASPDPRDYSEWDSVFDAGSDGIYARRTSLGRPAQLYRILPDGRQERLLRLPEYSDISISRNGGNIRLAWQSTRSHPVYLGHSVSDITIVDISPSGRVIGRRQLLSGSRYLYPALSPDGSRLAVVRMDRGSRSRLDILDAEDGSVLHTLDLGSDSAAWASWSTDGSKLVFTTRNDGGRRITEWTIGNPEAVHLTARTRETVKRPFYGLEGAGILYTSNKSGVEGLWFLDSSGSQAAASPSLVAVRPFGIEEPVPTADETGILLLEYDSRRGRQITRIETTVLKLPTSAGVEPVAVDVPETSPADASNDDSAGLMWPDRDPAVRDAVVHRGNTEYPEENYSVAANSLNVHSWGILPSGNLLTTTGLKLFVESSDVLGSSSLELGGTWDLIESSPGAYFSYTYSGMRPVLGVDFGYAYRDPASSPYHQLSVFGSAFWPGNLSRNGIWSHYLTPGFQGGYIRYLPTESSGGYPDYGLPVLGYSLGWYRLRRGSHRAIYPDAGWSASALYNHIPGSSGDQAAAAIMLYLPGGPANTSLRPAAALERRTIGFSPTVNTARGYDWSSPATVFKGTVDYDFPLAYPDWPIGSILFIQRFRIGFYSDFAFIGDANALSTGIWTRQWSTGASFTMDFAAFNQFDGFSLGFRFNWLWQERRPAFNLMIQDIAFL